MDITAVQESVHLAKMLPVKNFWDPGYFPGLDMDPTVLALGVTHAFETCELMEDWRHRLIWSAICNFGNNTEYDVLKTVFIIGEMVGLGNKPNTLKWQVYEITNANSPYFLFAICKEKKDMFLITKIETNKKN
jgi:hypothetical protein